MMETLLGSLFMAAGAGGWVGVARRTGDVLHPLGLMILFWLGAFGYGHWDVAVTYDEPYYALPFGPVTYAVALASLALFAFGYWLIDPGLRRLDGEALGARLRGCVRTAPLQAITLALFVVASAVTVRFIRAAGAIPLFSPDVDTLRLVWKQPLIGYVYDLHYVVTLFATILVDRVRTPRERAFWAAVALASIVQLAFGAVRISPLTGVVWAAVYIFYRRLGRVRLRHLVVLALVVAGLSSLIEYYRRTPLRLNPELANPRLDLGLAATIWGHTGASFKNLQISLRRDVPFLGMGATSYDIAKTLDPTLRARDEEISNRYGVHNTTTYLLPLYMDFGLFGLLVMPAVYGAGLPPVPRPHRRLLADRLHRLPARRRARVPHAQVLRQHAALLRGGRGGGAPGGRPLRRGGGGARAGGAGRGGRPARGARGRRRRLRARRGARHVRILLDLLPVLPRGGGLQNARNLWRAIAAEGGEHRWMALARPGLGLDEMPRAPWQELRVMEPGGSARRVAFGLWGLPRLARDWADVVFVPMGAGPLRSPVPVVMGWHDSTQAYPELGLDVGGAPARALRGAYARAAARRARVLCVQTPTMARRLAALWGVPETRFRIVPNGPSAFLQGEAPAPATPPPGPRLVLVPGEPKPAKNLEVVPALAAALARRGVRDVELVLTVAPEPTAWTAPLEAAFAAHPAGVPVRRVGRVPHARLGDLYRAASAVLLPSLVESFSATCVEAMHFGVPLVASDRGFARDVCGDAALYAEPTDPEALAEALLRALDDGALRARLREAGGARVAGFPDWSERLALYLDACRDAVGEGARPPAGGARAARPAAAAAPLRERAS